MFKTIVLYIKFLIYKFISWWEPCDEDYDNYLNEQLSKLDTETVCYWNGTLIIDGKHIIVDCFSLYGVVSNEIDRYQVRPSIKTMVKLEKLAEKSRIADYEKNKPAYLKRKIND